MSAMHQGAPTFYAVHQLFAGGPRKADAVAGHGFGRQSRSVAVIRMRNRTFQDLRDPAKLNFLTWVLPKWCPSSEFTEDDRLRLANRCSKLTSRRGRV